MNETKEKEEIPPLAASVGTLQEAVKLSLEAGITENVLFTFSRALKAFEITNNRRLPPDELQVAFRLWWSKAIPLLPPGADIDEWRFDFENTFAKTRAALGANSLVEAMRRAKSEPFPPQANRYTSPKLKLLVAVCYHLQKMQIGSPFFLSVRDAAKIVEVSNLNTVSAWMLGLVGDGILSEVEKGKGKRATRFRFNLPESRPADSINASPTQQQATAKVNQVNSEPKSNQTEPAKAPRKGSPTTYQLAERKKALQDLLKDLPHPSYWDAPIRKRAKQLKKELEQVNLQLAGLPPSGQGASDNHSVSLDTMRRTVE